MSNPIESAVETVWAWAKTAPLPVVLALVFGLGGWVYALEAKVAEQDTALARIEAKLDQVDTNVQTLLKAVLWANQTEPTHKEKN